MRRVVLSFVLLVFALNPVHGEDLRETYGTRSLEAASALDKGMKLLNDSKPSEAIVEIDKALAADPDLQMAIYWKAAALIDQGDVDAALKLYVDVLQAAKRTQVNNVTIDACIKAGITLSMLNRQSEASLWYTRAIMLDPTDKHQLHWKAYRNMAIGLRDAKQHFSAGVSALLGHMADPKRVDFPMVAQFISEAATEEVAQVLTFNEVAPARPAPRPLENDVDFSMRLPDSPEGISRILVDMATNRLIALVANSSTIYVFDCSRDHEMQTYEMPGKVRTGCISGGRLYLSVIDLGIVEVDLASFKALQTWRLSESIPANLAVLPARGVALFPAAQLLTVLDLDTGKTKVTDFVVESVANDPLGRYVFAGKRTDKFTAHVLVAGRPILLQEPDRYLQTCIMKFVVANKRPLLAEMRMNAASNGHVLHVSPDGRWVGIAGSGWNPRDHGGFGRGNGSALFETCNLAQIQGYYDCAVNPVTLAVNPVNGQVALLSKKDVTLRAIAGGGRHLVLPHESRGVGAWSADGKYFYLAQEKEIRVWTTELTDTEVTLAAAQQQKFRSIPVRVANPLAALSAQPVARPAEALAEYATFELKNDRQALLDALSLAESKGRTDRPLEWLQYAPYQQDKQLEAEFGQLVNKLDQAGAGLRVYRLRKLKETHAEHPGIDFLMGMSYFAGRQYEPATNFLLAAIHADQGATNLTLEALRCLAEIKKRQKQPLAAGYCFAHVLRLDRADPQRLAEAETFFQSIELAAEAQPLIALGKATSAGAATRFASALSLPPLPVAKAETRMSSEVLYTTVAPSVVLIKSDDGNGTGVCVGAPGVLVTNAHVVGDAETVQVYPFQMVKDQLERGTPITGRVVFKATDDDVAIVVLDTPPPTLKPLIVSDQAQRPGVRVYAVGNPGLGSSVLEQTITEGIISSTQRELFGKIFMQHTAAVNPGNSGGPLLDEFGQIVGIVTAKANLENISFAIPAGRIREIFSQFQAKK